jgi:hypothetical protein
MKMSSIGITMSNCYHPELKIAFVHVPKCAGTSISRELMNHGFVSAEDNQWYDYSFQQLEKIIDVNDYTIVSTVRHPISWMISGYKFCNYFGWTFLQHIEQILNPIKRSEPYYRDWYWHCAILPDKHFPVHTKVFHVEHIDRLSEWFGNQLNTNINIPHINKTSGIVDVNVQELELIKRFTKEYAHHWNYEY